jgi:RNA-binding protein
MKSTPPELNSSERKVLRGKAMALKPAFTVSANGITESVRVQGEAAFSSQSLIKVRFAETERDARSRQMTDFAEATASALCGGVGRTASYFRPLPERDTL